MKVTKLAGDSAYDSLVRLANLHDCKTVVQGFEVLLPALEDQVVALSPMTFVANVNPELEQAIDKLAKTYPSHYSIYLALTN